MVDAISLSGSPFRATGLRLAPPAAATPTTFAPAPAVSQAAPPEAVEDVGALDFLYAPGGQPQQDNGGRLAVSSDRLSALLTSLMQPSATAAGSVETGNDTPPAAASSVISRLYGQF